MQTFVAVVGSGIVVAISLRNEQFDTKIKRFELEKIYSNFNAPKKEKRNVC